MKDMYYHWTPITENNCVKEVKEAKLGSKEGD